MDIQHNFLREICQSKTIKLEKEAISKIKKELETCQSLFPSLIPVDKGKMRFYLYRGKAMGNRNKMGWSTKISHSNHTKRGWKQLHSHPKSLGFQLQ